MSCEGVLKLKVTYHLKSQGQDFISNKSHYKVADIHKGSHRVAIAQISKAQRAIGINCTKSDMRKHWPPRAKKYAFTIS